MRRLTSTNMVNAGAVEKYLPDTAALSFAGEALNLYITENKHSMDKAFEKCFQSA